MIFHSDTLVAVLSINELENNLIKSIIDISEKKKNIAFIHGNGELDTNYTKSSINILSEHYTVHQFDISKYEIDSSTGKLNIQKQLVVKSRMVEKLDGIIFMFENIANQVVV